MEKDAFDKAADEIKNASIKGAHEDLIHISSPAVGHDLRLSNPFGAGFKQERDENEQAGT